MAQFFQEEQGYPDNAPRTNFIFMAYPFTPPLSQDGKTKGSGVVYRFFPRHSRK